MLTLKNCEVIEGGGFAARYMATHKTDDGKVVTVAVDLTSNEAGAKATVSLQDHVEAGTEEDAFEALAVLLDAAAQAIRSRGEVKLGIPVYG